MRITLRFWWPVVAVVLCGAIATGMIFQLQRQLDRERQLGATAREAVALLEGIRERLNLIEERLVAVRSLLGAVTTVDVDQFAHFVRPLMESRVAVETVGWAPRVTESHFPMRYFEPYSANSPPVGHDLGSDPRFQATIEAARDSGQMTAAVDRSRPATASDMFVFLPVFGPDEAIDTVTQRRQALRGVVLGLVRLEPLIRFAAVSHLDQFSLVLRDPSDGRQLVKIASGIVGDEANTHRLLLEFAGNRLELLAIPNPIATETGSQSWLLLVLGTVSTLASGYVAFLLRVRNLRVISLVDQRTRDLQFSRQQLEESRERLRLALVSARMWAWDWDVATDRLIWMDEVATLLGPCPPEGWADFRDMVFAEDQAGFLAAGRAAMMLDVPYACEFRIQRTDGAVIWLQASGVAIRNEAGRVERMIGVSQDVTARKQAEEALRQALEAAQQASKTKSEFLATMSHEIRTPMNGVLGMAELLKMTELDAEQREFVGTLQDSGKALLRILNDILEFSKIESGQIELKPLPMEPCAIAQEACQLLQATAENKGLSLILQCEPGVPEVMLGDGDRLRQVVTNLISNGLKFTDQGQVVVRLLSVETAAGTRFRIEVIDSGIGIPESAQAKLFQPFSQADSSITRRFGGMGMGLAICKKLVEVMGGELGVSSVPGQGSTFWLEMPVQTE